MLTPVHRENRALFNLDRALRAGADGDGPYGLTFGQVRAASVTKRTLERLLALELVRALVHLDGRLRYELTPEGRRELAWRIANGLAATIAPSSDYGCAPMGVLA